MWAVVIAALGAVLLPLLPRFAPALNIAFSAATLAAIAWLATQPLPAEGWLRLDPLNLPLVLAAAVVGLALVQEPARYPKELIRLASALGNAKVVRACLGALTQVDDEDAWMDILIEGEPAMERTDVKLLRDLAEKAPSKQVAKLARQIAADLRA